MKSLVIGSGISGISAADLLIAKGVTPVIFDSKETLIPQEIAAKLNHPEEALVYVGSLPQEEVQMLDEVVISPGVPIDSEMVNELRDMGLPIIGEVELAYRYDKGKILAITGTNGKTTTTALLGKIIQDKTRNAFIVGNIGNAYTEAVLSTTKDSTTVAEISSFQLESIKEFHPVVSAILNITPDHLNRHHTMQQYIIEKEKITLNQTKDDWVILNYEDEELRRFGEELEKKGDGPRPFFFSSERKLEEGMYSTSEAIYIVTDGKEEELIKASELNIIGQHNLENAMAAIAMAHKYGIPMADILESCRQFKAVAHRIEFIAEKKGVKYYNDSKGTNVDAAIKGIMAMSTPTYLIGGGYDKGVEFDEWIDAFRGKVKKLVLIGQTREKIAACAKAHGFNDYVFAQDLKEAIEICASHANPGEAVLLSPACASWGMFNNYEERGDMFREIVKAL